MINFFLNFLPTRKIVHDFALKRGYGVVKDISPFIKKGEKILDLGAGLCSTEEILIPKGFDITPVDIRDLSVADGISPVVYDGKKLPFKDREFDKGMCLSVLHHIPDPVSILRELRRVCKEIVITEDIYTGLIHKQLTFWMDSLMNFEFFQRPPHSNKTDSEWRRVFEDLGLKVVDARYSSSYLVFKQVTFLLA